MKRKLSIRMVLGALALLGVNGLAGASETLKPNVAVGQKYTFTNTSSMSMHRTITAGGQSQDVDQKLETTRKGTEEILSVSDGKATAIKITFDQDCSGTAQQGDQKQPVPFALAGKTVTIKRGDDGKITSDIPDDVDKQTRDTVEKMIDPDAGIYPKNAIDTGDKWDVEGDDARKLLDLSPDDTGVMHCTLLKFGSADSRKSADIAMAGKVKKLQDGVTVNMTLGGVTQIDLLTGTPLQTDIVGKMDMDGTQTATNGAGQPVQVTITGTGELKVSQTVHMLDNADGGQSAPPPAAAAGGFAGKFKGESINLVLAKDTESKEDAFKGTLTIKDKDFPIGGTVQDGKLVGQFTSGDDKYDFTAALDGKTLTLTSNGKDHSLTRQEEAPSNPLDN